MEKISFRKRIAKFWNQLSGAKDAQSATNVAANKPVAVLPTKTVAASPQRIDPATVAFVVKFCKTHLGPFGLKKIVLMGSRAYGSPRPNSDHDFMAVVDDAIPDDFLTGRTKHHNLFAQMNRERKLEGLGGIDLFVTSEARFLSAERDTAPFKARTKGVEVYP